MATSANVTAEPVLTLTFTPSLRIVAARIDKLGLDIRSFRVPLKRCVKDVIIPSIQQNFEVGGRPTWAPYADVTTEIHQEMGEDLGDMLVKSGKLKQTMSYQNLWTITKDEASLDDLPPNVWYGKIHQAGYGGKGGKGSIPARPFVMLQEDDEQKIVDVFDKWLVERIEAAWPV